MEMVNGTYEKFERDIGNEGKLQRLKPELDQIKEREQQNRTEKEELQK